LMAKLAKVREEREGKKFFFFFSNTSIGVIPTKSMTSAKAVDDTWGNKVIHLQNPKGSRPLFVDHSHTRTRTTRINPDRQENAVPLLSEHH
jgi:hypothetical protein